MPPRPPPLHLPAGSFYPPSDAATFRDLLLFEERLKTNAASLNRRKRRYQLFLSQLLLIIGFLLCEVLLQTNWLGVPYKWVLHQTLPEIYPGDADVRVHPYFASGLLFVSVTTLVLFFASGMYSEKIGYANKYVPQANRALRNFNMYLNVRQPPLRSKLPFNPFTFLFARPHSPPLPASPPLPTTPHPPRRRSRSPSPSSTPGATSRRSSSVPIQPIPPASNPRGELIFSSRVDRGFREPYDRYRAQFERRREEREWAAYGQTWRGWLHRKMPWTRRASTPTAALEKGEKGGSSSGAATPMTPREPGGVEEDEPGAGAGDTEWEEGLGRIGAGGEEWEGGGWDGYTARARDAASVGIGDREWGGHASVKCGLCDVFMSCFRVLSAIEDAACAGPV
ncbi:hypothetical protein GSI_09433 [Ganoderma sinense ZZ0214-1]|uniref:Transmembrane protein 188 n=1 Tax=Ganoderma sinense ZZ0214-1 TaxID=1077348 RepID=A0A2G8S6J1_9APHY|nr:hypothetical protein GSI_09433 [Ganoderma sinense ZZ0214-1]